MKKKRVYVPGKRRSRKKGKYRPWYPNGFIFNPIRGLEKIAFDRDGLSVIGVWV